MGKWNSDGDGLFPFDSAFGTSLGSDDLRQLAAFETYQVEADLLGHFVKFAGNPIQRFRLHNNDVLFMIDPKNFSRLSALERDQDVVFHEEMGSLRFDQSSLLAVSIL